ncbi:hypothetical protein [Salinifilum ghardaiensis]
MRTSPKPPAPRGTARLAQPVASSPRAPVDPVEPGRRAPRRPGRAGRAVRGLSGTLAAGLCVLALTVLGVQIWMTGHEQQGPGFGAVAGQLVAALLALVLQRIAEHRGGPRGGLACLGVHVVVLGALALWWW